MTHLRIEQSTSGNEYVTSDVIHKLYETAKGILDEEALNEVEESQVSLQGSLVVPKAYGDEIDWLETKFPDLHITAGARYVKFADDAVYAILSWYLGDGVGVSAADMQRHLVKFGLDYTNPNTNLTVTTNNSTFNGVVTFNELQNINCDYIGYGVFSKNTTLQSIRLPSTVTELLNYSFQNCSALQSINLNYITTLGNLCFLNCTSLDNITLNNNLTSISDSCFAGCTSLTNLDLSNVTHINDYAFSLCTALESITSIQNATLIGIDTFRKCSNVLEFETLNLPNLLLLTPGQNGNFTRCTQIKHVVDLGTITEIGAVWDGTFYGCTELLDATLPETVTKIYYNCFKGCNKLRYVKVLSTQVPTYDTKNGFNDVQSYGCFFGEHYTNNNPVTDSYDGLTFPIYVKDNLLSQYQVADYWKYVGPNRLRPLSQFATDFPNG